jgi:hypothetical protein
MSSVLFIADLNKYIQSFLTIYDLGHMKESCHELNNLCHYIHIVTFVTPSYKDLISYFEKIEKYFNNKNRVLSRQAISLTTLYIPDQITYRNISVLNHLINLPRLKHLDIEFSAEIMGYEKEVMQLRHLKLESLDITYYGISWYKQMPITDLTITVNCKKSDELSYLYLLPLKKLNIKYSRFKITELARISAFNLTHLKICVPNDVRIMQYIKDMPLVELSVCGCIDDNELVFLKDMKLRKLTIDSPSGQFSGDGLKYIQHLPLTYLSINSNAWNNDSMQYLPITLNEFVIIDKNGKINIDKLIGLSIKSLHVVCRFINLENVAKLKLKKLILNVSNIDGLDRLTESYYDYLSLEHPLSETEIDKLCDICVNHLSINTYGIYKFNQLAFLAWSIVGVLDLKRSILNETSEDQVNVHPYNHWSYRTIPGDLSILNHLPLVGLRINLTTAYKYLSKLILPKLERLVVYYDPFAAYNIKYNIKNGSCC